MSSFTQFSAKLHTSYAEEASKILGDKYYWIDPGFTFYSSNDPSEVVEIQTGYLSDGASVPKILKWLIPAWGKHGQCAVVHDRLCETWTTNKRKLNRKEVDEMFFDSLKVAKVNIVRRKLIEWGVTLYRWYKRPTKPTPAPMKDILRMDYIKNK